VDRVIQHDAEDQRQSQESCCVPDPKQAREPEHNPQQCQLRNHRRGNITARNGPFLAMLPVEMSVERIIQIHATAVEKRHTHQKKRKIARARMAAQPPSSQTV